MYNFNAQAKQGWQNFFNILTTFFDPKYDFCTTNTTTYEYMTYEPTIWPCEDSTRLHPTDAKKYIFLSEKFGEFTF